MDLRGFITESVDLGFILVSFFIGVVNYQKSIRVNENSDDQHTCDWWRQGKFAIVEVFLVCFCYNLR